MRLRVKHCEQLAGHCWVGMTRKFKRWYKRLTAKAMRRTYTLGDDAPKRLPLKGWVD